MWSHPAKGTLPGSPPGLSVLAGWNTLGFSFLGFPFSKDRIGGGLFLGALLRRDLESSLKQSS